MSKFISLNQFDFHSTMEDIRGVAIVFFETEGCSSCHYWENILAVYKKEHPLINVFHIDAAQDQALTEEFEIFHLPALFLYMDGKFHSNIQCEAKLDALNSEIQKLMAEPAQEVP
ncbi:MAG: thioredoxin family protein [Gammaproteobacteria bacterium]|nr:thioredoxin family protein [Gammaproteobacteria bacterium]